MTDPDQPGEDFDDDVLGDEEYPPDRPLGVESDGITEVEEQGGESFYHRDRATEPEAWEEGDEVVDDEYDVGELVGDADVGVVDDEADLVASRAATGGDLGPLADDDQVSGDESTRDVASERVPPPAEETAVHLDDG